MTITPTKTDVKPTGNYNNPGNKLYTDLVKNKRKAFILAYKDTQTKNAILQSIYDAVRKQSPPGRFLKKDKDGSYSVTSKEHAFKKIKKALNENKAKIEEYFRLRGQFPPPEGATTRPTLTKMTSLRSIPPVPSSTKTNVLSPMNINMLAGDPHKNKKNFEKRQPKVKKDQQKRPQLLQPTLKITISPLTSTSTVYHQEKSKTTTYLDWLKLHDMLGPEEVKPMKRQKTRGILQSKGKNAHKGNNKKKKKKTSKKEKKNKVDDLCDGMQSHSLCDKGEESKMMRLGRVRSLLK
jgi:hypothetical protein